MNKLNGKELRINNQLLKKFPAGEKGQKIINVLKQITIS